MTDRPVLLTPDPLTISRIFPAPRALVFRAWSSADHLRRWFCPMDMEIPHAEMDFRPGGRVMFTMRPVTGGEAHEARGVYQEIIPNERIVVDFAVVIGEERMFSALTTAVFTDAATGTKLTVTQHYQIFHPDFLGAVEGAAEGWASTMANLDRELARMAGRDVRDAVHDSFTLDRVYPVAPAVVFRAFTDPEQKRKWFAAHDDCVVEEWSMDVRPGGREHLSGRWTTTGVRSHFDAVYHDVIAQRRLVYSYEMHLDERKISVSLATVTFVAEGAGTKVTVTEHGVFLDGFADNGGRKMGTGWLLDQLGKTLPR